MFRAAIRGCPAVEGGVRARTNVRVIYDEAGDRRGRDVYEADSGARRRLRLRLRLPRAGAAFLSGIEACGCERPERWTVNARGLTVSSLRPGKHRSALRSGAQARCPWYLRSRTFYRQVRHVRFRLVLHLL